MDSDDDVVVLYEEGCSDNESDTDMDYIDSACSVPEPQKNDVEEYTYQVLSTDEILQHMREFVREVNSVLEMTETVTRLLLHHFNWDKQKLLDRFYDGNQEKLFEEAHIVNPFKTSLKGNNSTKSSQKSLSEQASSDSTEDCEVCYTSLPASKLTGLECGHRFCTDCWNDYLRIKIMDEGIGQTIACAAHKCGILVDDETVMKLVKDPMVKQKYQNLITNSFVDCNKLMRWCASPGCNRAVKVQYVDSKPVTCKCQRTFCFECGEKWHEPLSCDLLRQWEKKCRDGSETTNWLVTHTKECPKCNWSIEKNGGCHHMCCRKCNHQFCWLCLCPWDAHGYERGCNVYGGQAIDPQQQRNKSKAALERYLFYSNRYMSHLTSFGHENELYASVNGKISDMDEHNMSWAEAQFLKRAVDTLVSCRQTLMYTYVLAYYLTKNNQTAIFEANQQDLEHAVEILSGYLERDIAVENLAHIKQRIIDRYVYCEGRRQTLLKHVREGHEQGWLTYTSVID